MAFLFNIGEKQTGNNIKRVTEFSVSFLHPPPRARFAWGRPPGRGHIITFLSLKYFIFAI